VLDGEVVCLDEDGRPRFNRPLRRRGVPCFVAFDVLRLDGKDVRALPLLRRQRLLRRIVPRRSPAVLYADHPPERTRSPRGEHQTPCRSPYDNLQTRRFDYRLDVIRQFLPEVFSPRMLVLVLTGFF
jgi:hypothetical protein